MRNIFCCTWFLILNFIIISSVLASNDDDFIIFNEESDGPPSISSLTKNNYINIDSHADYVKVDSHDKEDTVLLDSFSHEKIDPSSKSFFKEVTDAADELLRVSRVSQENDPLYNNGMDGIQNRTKEHDAYTQHSTAQSVDFLIAKLESILYISAEEPNCVKDTKWKSLNELFTSLLNQIKGTQKQVCDGSSSTFTALVEGSFETVDKTPPKDGAVYFGTSVDYLWKDGTVRIRLPPGVNDVTFRSNTYIHTDIRISVTTFQSFSTVRVVEKKNNLDGTGRADLVIRDALNTKPPNQSNTATKSQIILRPGANMFSIFTDSKHPLPEGLNIQLSSEGTAEFPEVAPGTYSFEIIVPGYRTSWGNVAITTVATKIKNNIFISPVLKEGQVLRAILSWADTPKDLDLHLLIPTAQGSELSKDQSDAHRQQNISWNDTGGNSAPAWAGLDWDCMTGYGPETTTLYKLLKGKYKIYVNQFDEYDGNIKNSRAKVILLFGNGDTKVFELPMSGSGNNWDVCEIDGETGAVKELNFVYYKEPDYSEYSVNASEKKIQKQAARERLAHLNLL